MASSEVPRAFEAEGGGVEEIAPALVASKVAKHGLRLAFSAAGLNLKSAPRPFAAGTLRVLIERCWDHKPERRPSWRRAGGGRGYAAEGGGPDFLPDVWLHLRRLAAPSCVIQRMVDVRRVTILSAATHGSLQHCALFAPSDPVRRCPP